MPPFTYDPTTDRGRVRMLITDRNAATEIFNDGEIDAYLLMMGSNVLRAAALALMTIASEEALQLKVIKLLELTTDGAKLADSLRALALQYQEKADLAEAGEAGGAFDIAELVVDDFTYRERLDKEALRGG